MNRSLRLLLVEDDDDTAFLMRKSLERAGHQVMTCATTVAALLAVRQGKFDLISLNQVLPDGYGLDLLQALRREGVQTPTIMVSGLDDPALIVQVIRAGALDFVVKDRALAFLAELPERVARAALADTDSVELDPLTGLPCRTALQAWLKESCESARRLGQPLSLLALDLDDFRQLNMSQIGLPGGDQLLVAVARLLSSLARPGQWLFRDGGDQFTVILPGAGGEEAYREAERFRLAVAAAPLEVRCGGSAEAVAVTVSVGVATFAPGDTDAWQLFLRAREAVHRAKGAGRNRVSDGSQYRRVESMDLGNAMPFDEMLAAMEVEYKMPKYLTIVTADHRHRVFACIINQPLEHDNRPYLMVVSLDNGRSPSVVYGPYWNQIVGKLVKKWESIRDGQLVEMPEVN